MDRHDPDQVNIPAVSEEYSLEDIMREFGTAQPQAPKKEEVESPKSETPAEEAPIKIFQPKAKVSSDTMVFKPIRIEQAEPDLEAPTKIAAQSKTPPVQIQAVEPPQKKTEKPSMITEIPKLPDPPSAQEQLKACRKGLSMRHIRILGLSLVVLFGLFILLYQESNWTFFPFIAKMGYVLPLILLLSSIALAYDVYLKAARDLLKLRIGLHTLSCIASVLVILFTVSQKDGGYCPIVALLLLAQLKARHAKKVGTYHTLRTICNFETPMGIFDTPKLTENKDSLCRADGDIPDFLHRLEHRNAPRKAIRLYSSVLLVVQPILAYLICTSKSLSFIHAWLLLLLGSIPYAMSLSFARPFSLIAKRLAKYQGALCGWHGARIFGGKHTIVLSDEELFPKKNIASNGMKIYGAHKAPRIIAYALAALELVESPLVDLFCSLLDAQYGKHYPITEHRIYDDGGIGAQIAGDIVLVGSLSFMRSMGVHMPAGTRVRQAVYVSVNGELAGVFAVKYKPSSSSRTGLRDILANRNFSIILATKDFLIAPDLIAAKYELPTETMRIPPYSERLRIAKDSSNELRHQGAMIAKDTFGAFAVTVASGRTLRLSTIAGLCISLFAGILGFLLCILLLSWNALDAATPLHIATFQLLWGFLSSFVSFMFLKF